MTLDEYKKKIDEAVEIYAKTIKGILVEASKEPHDPVILMAILEQSFNTLEKKMEE